MIILKYSLILCFFIFFSSLLYSNHETCFYQNPNKVYFYSKGYSNLCENIPISKIYITNKIKKKQVIFEIISNITKELKSNEIYILEFNFDESSINIEEKFFKNMKFKLIKDKIKGQLYKNTIIGKNLVYYAKEFEKFNKHNKIDIYINIIEPIVFAKTNIKKNENINEKNVYFIYKINTNFKKEYLSLNELNKSNYIALDDIIKNKKIPFLKIQKIK